MSGVKQRKQERKADRRKRSLFMVVVDDDYFDPETGHPMYLVLALDVFDALRHVQERYRGDRECLRGSAWVKRVSNNAVVQHPGILARCTGGEYDPHWDDRPVPYCREWYKRKAEFKTETAEAE